MYWRSILISKSAALLVALAVLFLFLVDPVWPASKSLWPDVPGQPRVSLKGTYQEIQPGLTYDPAHFCVVDHNGPSANCAPGMPIILYEYNDPGLIPACGPATYPFQVDGISLEICNPAPLP